ncbi:MAG: magnesium transporter [Candidatus Geothermincolia bacterium]
MEEHNRLVLETIGDLVEGGDNAGAIGVLAGLHAADAAEVLVELSPEDRLRLLREWDPPEAAPALQELPADLRLEVVGELEAELSATLLAELPPDEVADILGNLKEERRENLLELMGRPAAASIRRLLQHGEKTAGGHMTPLAARFSHNLKVDEVIERLRRMPEDVEMVYYLYFEDEEDELIGVLSLRQLIVAAPDAVVGDLARRDMITVRPETDQEEVARLIDRYDLLAVPVVDRRNRMLGIVTVDDVMDVIEEEAKEDIYSLAGTFETEEARERSPFLAAVIGRSPWLAGALLAEMLLAGGILRAYSETLEASIALVFFVPLVMIMGGTVAVLNSTRVVRDFMGAEVAARKWEVAVESLRETAIGIGLGGLAAGLVGLAAWVMEGNTALAAAVGVSLVLTVAVASLAGSVAPFILKALRLDPAKASEPLLATLMDVLALSIYLSVGMALL